MKIHEQDSNAYNQELLNAEVDYNKKIHQLTLTHMQKLQLLKNEYGKKRVAIASKYNKQLPDAQNAQQQTTNNQANQPNTGNVDTTGNPVNAQGAPVVSESNSIIVEGKYDTKHTDRIEIQSLKDYLDAENISYIEDEDETYIDFDDEDVDDEYLDILEPVEDDEFAGDFDEDFEDEDFDIADEDARIDKERVFYVEVEDGNNFFTGKIYKLFDDGDWRSKIVDGESKTFEKLNFDPDFDEFDIIAFLRENYDDAILISKGEFNDNVEDYDEMDYE